MVRVLRVQPDSIAAELGITPGAELLAVNGRPLEEFLDWEFLTADDSFELEAKLGIWRHALHARSLELPHPHTHERVVYRAPWPVELAELLELPPGV